MSRLADPGAMAPSRAGATRTAPPLLPARFPFAGRYASYTAFGLMSVFFVLQSVLVLEAAWQLGSGAEAWNALIERFRSPLYLLYHVLCLGALVYTGIRFFFRLFAKSQPPHIGPFPRPPLAAFPLLFGAAWLLATVVLLAVFSGVWP